MTFTEAKVEQERLETESSVAGDELRAFPRNAMGLVSDATRATPEYRRAKARSDAAFAALRNFNAFFTKTFAKEMRAARASRYETLEARAPTPAGRRHTGRKKAGRAKPKAGKKRRTVTRLRRVRVGTRRRGWGVLRSSMSAGFRGLAERENIAANKFYDYASSQGFTDVEARKILKVYLKHRVIKIDAVNGSFHVKHGAFLDRETMENALR